MGEEIITPQFHQSDSEEDRIINSYYCGQILILHYLLHYIFKSKLPMETVVKFIEARYAYLIHQYPNFYNQLVKNEKELKGESHNAYKVMLEAMMRHYEKIFGNDDRKKS